jgi:hypothetical protein
MSENLTEVICVFDKSGSMGAIRHEAIRMFNDFLADQKAQPGQARLTLLFFDNHVTPYCRAQDIQTVAPLTEHNYIVGSGTALLDAIIVAINYTRTRLNPGKKPIGFNAGPSAPKVIFVILTDGEENSSRFTTRPDVYYAITDCQISLS